VLLTVYVEREVPTSRPSCDVTGSINNFAVISVRAELLCPVIV